MTVAGCNRRRQPLANTLEGMPMLKKLLTVAVLLCAFALAGSASALSNGWWPQRTISNYAILDSNLGPICQFQLSDQSLWAFRISTREKLVDAVQTSMTSI